jgi:Glycosyltransferase family 87
VREWAGQLDFTAVNPTATGARSVNWRRFIAVALIAAVFLGAAGPTFFQICSGHKIPDDFTVVYNGARAMWNHLDIHDATNGMYIYSPFLAFVFQPLTAFSLRVAALIWLVLSALMIFGSVFILARKVNEVWSVENNSWPIAAIALLLSFEKIRSDFILGQTDCLILIGLVAMLCVMEGQPFLAGLATGITANFKYLALIFIPYFIIRRNFRAAVVATASFLFLFALPAAEVGLRLIKVYANNALATLVKVIGGGAVAHSAEPGRIPVVNSITWENSVSLTSSLLRATRAHGVPDGIAALVISLLFCALAATLVLIGRRWNVDLFKPSQASRDHVATINWASLIVLALAFGPQTTARHMILMMLVYTVALGIFFVQRRMEPRLALVISMIATAIALSLPFRETGPHPLLKSLKEMGAANWCAAILMLLIAWIGCRTISKTAAIRDE